MRRKVVILGAAGRDFHNFNMVYRNDPGCEVVAFTATQIPDIAGRRYPPELAGPLYPEGIPIVDESGLSGWDADEVVFAYSDVSHEHVMHLASQALAQGADFRLLGPRHTQLRASLPVIAVTAARTGAGKSQTTRKLARLLREAGRRVAVLRHPMPYGELAQQACQHFAGLEDLERFRATLEECEEYAPYLEEGQSVWAGVDYELILDGAQRDADVLLWDGGNNDFPFLVPDLWITLVDPHRAGHELSYFPGEVNLRGADVIIINKVDSALAADVERLQATVASVNPRATVIRAASRVVLEGHLEAGQSVVVVEDGPSLTHGGLASGAGLLAARACGARVVDPRPYAVGSLRDVYARFPHMGPVLPAMGYSPEQRQELRATLEACPAEVVVAGTPIDLTRALRLTRPCLRVRYDLQEEGPGLSDLLVTFLSGTGRTDH